MERPAALPRTLLYMMNSRVLMIGPNTDAEEHVHHLLQITVGLDAPVRMEIQGRVREFRAALLASDTAHRFVETGRLHSIVLLDPETRVAGALVRKHLAQGPFAEIPASAGADELRLLHERGTGLEEAQGVLERFLRRLLDPAPDPAPRDARIAKVLETVRGLPEKKAGAAELAASVNLSEGRFIHLFSREVGIPFRRYLLWRRLNDAIGGILRGVDFTRAAHDAGFSDSAHLSRTFRAMFGTTLLEYFKGAEDSRFVQVVSEPF